MSSFHRLRHPCKLWKHLLKLCFRNGDRLRLGKGMRREAPHPWHRKLLLGQLPSTTAKGASTYPTEGLHPLLCLLILLPADPSTVELFGINPGSEGTLYDCRVPCYDYNDHSAVDLMVRRSCFLDVMQSNYHDYLVPAFSYCHCQFHYHYY